ncbi:hypothetical protein LCGC14_0939000 [marine sediment metagenome]|uniref:Uncharacterized protein n=1 Tax=marine sediment metagenome TaxID=412755 RepID=A0A0F9P6T4_9ZZZZ
MLGTREGEVLVAESSGRAMVAYDHPKRKHHRITVWFKESVSFYKTLEDALIAQPALLRVE